MHDDIGRQKIICSTLPIAATVRSHHRGYSAIPEAGTSECPYTFYRTWATAPAKANEIVEAVTGRSPKERGKLHVEKGSVAAAKTGT
jgi:hypothetical protein